jgi:putative endonuclease
MSASESSLRDARNALLSVRNARDKDGRPSRDHRRALGRYGEKLALEHLRARGFSLLARNYRTRRGEIDLIAFNGCTLIFIQVKTRQLTTSQMRLSASPQLWLSASQMARYRSVAQAWLHDDRYAPPVAERMRFDAIGVLVDADGELVDLQHIEGGE